MTRVAIHIERSPALMTVLGATLAALFASALAARGFGFSVAIVTFAGLIVFFPGMSMVISVRELAAARLQAGMANGANAIVQTVGIVFGVAVGSSLATSWLGTIPSVRPEPFAVGVQIAAAALVGLGFVITLRAPIHDAIWTCSAAVIAVVAHLAGAALLGRIAGVFAAAFVVGVTGNAIARRISRSPLPFIVPGSLMLVPSSIGYESASSLFARQAVTGIDTAVDAVVALLAIAYGLVASTLVLPDPSTTPSARRDGDGVGH